jgi:hypothetical protein
MKVTIVLWGPNQPAHEDDEAFSPTRKRRSAMSEQLAQVEPLAAELRNQGLDDLDRRVSPLVDGSWDGSRSNLQPEGCGRSPK